MTGLTGPLGKILTSRTFLVVLALVVAAMIMEFRVHRAEDRADRAEHAAWRKDFKAARDAKAANDRVVKERLAERTTLLKQRDRDVAAAREAERRRARAAQETARVVAEGVELKKADTPIEKIHDELVRLGYHPLMRRRSQCGG